MAAQPQQSSSSSSSSLFTSLSNYDVFLSFSGKDTRATFTGHLYHDLDQAGIRTFMDEEELKKGETIGPNLFKAIKESRISIPIFSESYASSKWCLNELLQMMDCRRDEGQLVLPIFFHVDPRQVRNQIEGFGDQFMELAKRFDTVTVERWKSALREAGELKGWHLTLNGNESELTQEIVRKVQSELNNAKLYVAKHLVGINHHIEHMRRLLIHSNDESKDFGIVGIHGMVGIGKSTIARAVFNQIFRSFDGSSFRENVREDAQEKGLVYLQDRLLFDVLQLDQSISTVSRGKKMIEERLHAKKVLIVLDDVDKNEQLEALAGGPDWFGSGSRIIITTRNEHLLNVHNVYPIYRPKELDFEQSLRLFSKYAFGEDQPPEGYMELAKDVILIAGGLPLALEVLGSFLYDKEFPTEWESALKKWKTILPDQVLNLLKISYDELDREERDIILDTACFFTGMDKEYAIDMEYAIDIWEGCGFSPRIGIKNLIHKSLIKTSNHNELRMHELFRDMGKQIVIQESPNELGKRSRLWSHKEVMTVLKECTGTRNVKALLLKSEGKEETALEEFCFSTEAFATMSELRLLRIDNTSLVGGFEHLPSGLGWFSWKGCPLEFLSSDFPLEKLVVLDLSYSKIKQVWNGHHSKQFEKLKVLDLSNCHYLIETPDFLRFPNLERLILEECKQLVEVHESIGHLKRLAFLNFAGCNNLKELPCSICMLKSLKNLTLSRCSIVNMLPGNLVSMESLSVLLIDHTAIEHLPGNIGSLKNLRRLSLNGCYNLKELSGSICDLKLLEELILSGCPVLNMLPGNLGAMESLSVLLLDQTALEYLPGNVGLLKNLRRLSLNKCNNLKELPGNIGDLKSLEDLILSGCSTLKELPGNLGAMESLSVLLLDQTAIKHLPGNIGLLKNLKRLSLNGCNNLEALPGNIGDLTSLEDLTLSGCSILKDLPGNLGAMESLLVLLLDQTAIEHLPGNIGLLKNLRRLSLNQCNNLKELPGNIGDLKSLEDLVLSGCSILNMLPGNLGTMESLSLLLLDHTAIEHLPGNIGLLKNLRRLSLNKCNSLKELPGNIGDLKSLEYLILSGCSNLKELPGNLASMESLSVLLLDQTAIERLPGNIGHLKNLRRLSLNNCYNLKGLPSSICDVKSLENLIISGCSSLKDIPANLDAVESLSVLY